MIVCPLCEHAQPGGLECEMCGRQLADVAHRQAQGERPAEPGAAPLEGLEPTLQRAAAAPAPEVLPDLEPTGHAPAAAPVLPGDSMVAQLEPTRSAPTGPAIADPVPELERIGETIPDEERTPFPALVTCRYCGTEGGLGERLCGRCGMRLPLPAAFPPSSEEAGTRCGCGLLITTSRCPACGARRAG